MSLAVRHAVARPVPPINRSIMYLQRMQCGRSTLVKELLDIFLHLRAEHHPVTGRILLKDLQDALFHPFITKSDARAGIAQMVTDGPGIHRLLEERDTSLIPQALAEQDGRDNRTGQHSTRNK